MFKTLKGIFTRTTALSDTRNYKAAKRDNANWQWVMEPVNTNSVLRDQLKTLRGRSRDLYNNNDYFRRWIVKCGVNVIGHNGVKFQSRVMSGTNLNQSANAKIEKAWAQWGRKGICTADGLQSFIEVQKNMVEGLKRDGEVLYRKLKGWKGNDFGFALQPLDVGVLDESFNNKLASGNEVIMSVEIDSYGKPVAYHLIADRDGKNTYSQAGKRYVRVPADEILHVFITEYVGQVRGVPQGVTAISRLKLLDGYDEAEVVNARISATKMGFFKQTGEGEYTGEHVDPDDPDSAFIDDARPGEFEVLPRGFELQSWDPQHNNSTHDQFMKRGLKGIAAGFGINYTTMANDLEGVNFSSIRSGTIEDRDEWRMCQAFVISHFLAEIFDDWLLWAFTFQKIALPIDKIDKFNEPRWRARGWEWVDPKKDVEAALMAFNGGLTSLSEIVGQRGGDFEEVLRQISAEKKMAESLGIDLVMPTQFGGDDDGEEIEK